MKNHLSTKTLMFITLFLDLVGFSIIFPLFPSLLYYYLGNKANDPLFQWTLQTISQFSNLDLSSDAHQVVVLFGGFLGAIYALLQFITAPHLGRHSDPQGRKPWLILTSMGMVISYGLWAISDNFTLLVLSRVIGGIMSGNISIVTAVMADITNEKDRTKGMAIIGIAFGTGFILGPAFGGMLSLINLPELLPSLASYGFNPFSAAAIFAGVLSIINFVVLSLFFKETLLQQNSQHNLNRTFNVLKLFTSKTYPGVTTTQWAYFSFSLVFTAIEFTLTFLALDRLHYSPVQLSSLFVLYGITSAIIQGWYVRTYVRKWGEHTMCLHGLLITIPGLILIGSASNSFNLFLGILLMAIGTAQVFPNMTALSSLYTPSFDQGRILGNLRSLGALARVMGPIVGCVIYWKLGSLFLYCASATFTLVPIALVRQLDKKPLNDI